MLTTSIPTPLVLDVTGHGVRPDSVDRWLDPLQAALVSEPEEHPVNSVEVTGAWKSDFRLCHQLEYLSHRVVRIGPIAPEEDTGGRLRCRTAGKVPVT